MEGLLIGLTGGIATGKTTVARLLAGRGAFLVDADQVSRDLQVPGSPVLQAMVEAFGAEILDAAGALDRAALARRVFASPSDLERLNELTHPPIWREILRRLGEERRRHPVVVLVAPLLLEHGAEAIVDQVWVVAVHEREQLRRLMSRDGLTREAALRRVRSQMPTDEKAARSDVVIDNSGSEEDTEAQVAQAWEEWVAPVILDWDGSAEGL